jgi:hypothetical protein
MKEYITVFLKRSIFFFCLISSTTLFANSSSGTYAQLSSSKTQLPGASSKVLNIEIIDGISGLTVASNNKVIIEEEGNYFISVSAQVGNQGLGLLGWVDLYLMKNGKAIQHTNVRQVVDSNVPESLGTQCVLHLKVGDYISAGIDANAPNLGVIASKKNSGQGSAQSVIFSIFKIS